MFKKGSIPLCLQCTVYGVKYSTQYSIHCTVYSTVYNVQYSIQFTVQYTVYSTVYSTVYIVHCTVLFTLADRFCKQAFFTPSAHSVQCP